MSTIADIITREHHKTHTVLRMSHGKANALDLEFADRLVLALEEEEASDTRAIVLTGSGSIFSAGVDLRQALEGGRDYAARFVPAMARMFMKLFTITKPVIAAVNGHAIAGGCVMACASDHALMARASGRIGVPELKVGVPFPPVALEVLRAAVEPSHFEEIVYRGETFAPEEALSRGFVNELVTPHTLMSRAAERAAELGAVPPRTFALTKMSLRTPAVETIERLNREIGEQVIEAWGSNEVLAAMRAYVEKTLGRK